MTNRIDIKTAWMEHEGGSKFYQVFEFIPTGGKGVTLTHWGKLADRPRWARPVQGGETQTKPGLQMTAKTLEKTKRGYKLYDTRSSVLKRDDPWFVQTFGAALAWSLEHEMFNDGTREAPTPKPDTSIVPGALAPIVERPANWGTW